MENIKIENVWRDESITNEVVQFWKLLGALPKKVDPYQRAKQLLLVARNTTEIVGVCTAEEKRIVQINNKPLFNYRSLIHPKYRMPGLVDYMASDAVQFLERLYHDKRTECIGVITLIESKYIQKIKNKPVYPASGLTFAGYTKNGAQIRIKYFKGVDV